MQIKESARKLRERLFCNVGKKHFELKMSVKPLQNKHMSHMTSNFNSLAVPSYKQPVRKKQI